MAKLTLTDITAGYDTATINAANNLLIETAVENTLSRDGTSPNQMEANLDMNSYRIQNLPTAVANSEPLTLAQASSLASISTAFTKENIGAVFYAVTADETAAGITPTNYYYEVGNVKRYGATGDGATNDTTAFQSCSSVINQQDGGKFIIPPGTYIVGSQTLAGTTGLGYSYLAASMIALTSCAKPVIIEGNGAILKIADSMKFGAFDPTTGNSYASTPPFTDADYAASVGNVISVTSCANTTIRNLELDGNMQNITLGGQWGDTGYQLAAYGISSVSNSQVLIENVYTHHHGTDGVYVKYASLTETSEATPHTLINVRSEYNGRQGMSWVGGIGLTAIDCKFNHTGKSTFASSPKAGVDVEAESSVCRNGTFINCEFINNVGVGFLADTGDSADISLQRCKFIGTTTYAIWPQKPRISFEDCLIVGTYVNSYVSDGSTTGADATRYTRCLFSDEAKYGATIYLSGALLSLTSAQTGVTYTDCTFNTTESKPGRFDNSTLINCTFNLSAGTGYISNNDFVIDATEAIIENITINDNITVDVPAGAYYVNLTSGFNNQTMRGTSIINSTNSKVLWYSASTGYTGLLYNSEQKFSNIVLGGGFTSKESKILVDSAAPVAGDYLQGDIVFNSAPAAGGAIGWACTVGGTPGTWVTFGAIEAANAYTPTNVSTDRAYDADTVAVAELADVVGTLITDLQGQGILK